MIFSCGKCRDISNITPIKLEVIFIQSGISKSTITGKILIFLICAESYIKKNTRADLII